MSFNIWDELGKAGKGAADDWLDRLRKKQQRQPQFSQDDNDDLFLSETPPPPEAIAELDDQSDWRLLCPMTENEEDKLRKSIELSDKDKDLFDCDVPTDVEVDEDRLRRIGAPNKGVFRFNLASRETRMEYTVLILTAGQYGLNLLLKNAISKSGALRMLPIKGTFVASFFRTGPDASPPFSHRGMVIKIESLREGNIFILDREKMTAQGNFTAESLGPGRRGFVHLNAMVQYINFMTDYIFLAYVRYVARYMVENSSLLVETRTKNPRLQKMADYEQSLAQSSAFTSYLPSVPNISLFRGEILHSDAGVRS